jgi:transposase
LLFPENIGELLSLDETEMSNGELYTILTNKSAKGKQGSIVAMVAGTKSEEVASVINKIPITKRQIVQEVTVDMANNMNLIVRRSFPQATIVIDRFHVQKLAGDAVQDIRIKFRWEAIDKENQELEMAKNENYKYTPNTFSNGDTIKQLLARSRHLLFKPETRWTSSQFVRSKILFEQYPDIEKAYHLSQKLSYIYENNTNKNTARTKLAHWYKDVEKSEFKAFNTVARSIYLHYDNILNYFNNRSTNASAESFNAKIKRFRAEFRGVKDLQFFLFRLTRIFA